MVYYCFSDRFKFKKCTVLPFSGRGKESQYFLPATLIPFTLQRETTGAFMTETNFPLNW